MTATEIGARLAERAEAFSAWIFPNGKRRGHEWCVGSLSGEAGNSLKICVAGSRPGCWVDFGGAQEDRGDLIGLFMRARGLTLGEACEQALDWLNVPTAERNSNRQVSPPKAKRLETRPPSETWVRIQKELRKGTLTEFGQVATLRRIPALAGLELATNAGHLWFADIWDDGFEWPCWILTDASRHNAQARRLDGTPFTIDGRKVKAKTLPGCEASWPVGIAEAKDKQTIFLVEGGPDLLAAWHLIWLGAMTATTAPVAMFGISNAIHGAALPLFRGKAVRIFPHNDPDMTGLKGAMRWRSDLLEAGATAVDFFDFRPEGNKDLNDMITQYGIPELKEVV